MWVPSKSRFRVRVGKQFLGYTADVESAVLLACDVLGVTVDKLWRGNGPVPTVARDCAGSATCVPAGATWAGKRKRHPPPQWAHRLCKFRFLVAVYGDKLPADLEDMLARRCRGALGATPEFGALLCVRVFVSCGCAASCAVRQGVYSYVCDVCMQSAPCAHEA